MLGHAFAFCPSSFYKLPGLMCLLPTTHWSVRSAALRQKKGKRGGGGAFAHVAHAAERSKHRTLGTDSRL